MLTTHIEFQNTAKVRFGFVNETDDGPGLKDNLLQINVYFQSLNVRRIVENPKYVVSCKNKFQM